MYVYTDTQSENVDWWMFSPIVALHNLACVTGRVFMLCCFLALAVMYVYTDTQSENVDWWLYSPIVAVAFVCRCQFGPYNVFAWTIERMKRLR